MKSDSAEIKPAQCCIKLVSHLTYTMMHGSTKLKFKNIHLGSLTCNNFYWVSGDKNDQRLINPLPKHVSTKQLQTLPLVSLVRKVTVGFL